MILSELIKDVSQFSPLSILQIEWLDPYLSIRGEANQKKWGFATMSSWRITKNKEYICGRRDINAEEFIRSFGPQFITKIDYQSSHLPVDPILFFSNGYQLEIFSNMYLEPWIFTSPSIIVYVASPSDEECVG